MAGNRVTLQERERIIELLKAGLGRNKIMAEVSRSADTVSRIAAESGHVFAKKETAANHARRAYCAQARERLRLGLLAEAERLMAQLREPHTVYTWTNVDGEPQLVTATLPEPDPRSKQQLLTSIGIAIDKAELIEHNNQAVNADDGKGAMLAFFEAMGVKTEAK